MKLMMIIENSQVVIEGGLSHLQPDRAIALAIGIHKLVLIKLGISLFSKISLLIFFLQGLYPEAVVQHAATVAMSTTIAAAKIGTIAKDGTVTIKKRVIRELKTVNHHSSGQSSPNI